MANVNINPPRVLLTSGQAATFEASDANGKPVPVNWSITPPLGNIAGLTANDEASSATYIAPPTVTSSATVALVASTSTTQILPMTQGSQAPLPGSASASIELTPDAIVVVPAKADLKAKESQQFFAMVAGYPPVSKVDWLRNPPSGHMDEKCEGCTWLRRRSKRQPR
jgi:hypothetical protein